jgi:chaperonin GroES
MAKETAKEATKVSKSSIGVRPLHDRILVRRMAEEEKTAGGLFIPDTAKEKPSKGEIVAAGKGRVTEDGKTMPLEVKVGDRVLFGKYSGTELKFEGSEYLMMREEDILGIIN